MKSLATHAETASPFHEGEQRIQTALGVREQMEPWGRQVVRPFMPEEHAHFYHQLPFVVAAARDERGRPWATLLAGAPGFIAAPDNQTLSIGATLQTGDALAGSLKAGSDLGLLGIELETRRRNRVNGHLLRASADRLEFAVDQAFGNCPQHIHARTWRPAAPRPQPDAPQRATRINAEQRTWIQSADTFFIASGHPGEGPDSKVANPSKSSENARDTDSPNTVGMDASHRGGPAGFVEVESERLLVFPDYAGNNHFNTLGNLILDPRAGLLFVDFETGSLLQLSGRAYINWDSPDPARYPGAQRLVHFEVDEIVEQRGALPLRWLEPGAGTRELTLVERVVESDDTVSFRFEDPSGSPIPNWKPGQHLPLEIELAGGTPLLRTYSLSNAPGSNAYRISVKREPKGQVSRHLHDSLEPGAVVRAQVPSGSFSLELDDLPPERPILLIGAGVGITPLASMLHALSAHRPDQQVALVHGVRDGAHHALGEELRSVMETLPNGVLHVSYSQPRPDDNQAGHYDSVGRVNAGLLAKLAPLDTAEIFLCGPAGFLAQLTGDLERRGVLPSRIHYETF